MNAVYSCLEDGKVGIFESPTGTGKSLSLICGSLTWLRDHKRRTFEEGFKVSQDDHDEPAWILEHAQKQKRQEALHRKRDLDDRLARIKTKERRAKERHEGGEPSSKRLKMGGDVANGAEDEAQFALDDYESDEDNSRRDRLGLFNESGFSTETQALMAKLGFSTASTSNCGDDAPDETKIFFCSRTHSQLTQFSTELGRVKMPPALVLEEEVEAMSQKALIEEIRHLTLGSRKNLCINSKVKSLGHTTAINERCIELQQSSKIECRCQYMPTKENATLLDVFRDHALARIRDIEDLGSLGKKLGICPYYASRPVIKYSEIVTLPYPLLLQKSAREALGLSLKDHVVIIDEAHNLMDAISGIYTVSVTYDQLRQARSQLTVYLQKFRHKLKGKNRVYVAQILRIIDSIIAYLQPFEESSKPLDGITDMVSIMSGKGINQINIYKLNEYLQESKLARKVDGYTTFVDQMNKEVPREIAERKPRQQVPVLMHVQSFLLSLMNPSAEGRFFYSKEDGTSATLRYMLLDPTFHFKEIVEEARAVVLAGGTMSPMSDYEQHLLAYLHPSKIMTLSCGHVIPPSNLLAAPVTQAPSGTEFDFTFGNRSKEKTMTDLGNALLGFVQHIPDGVVVFFPSYSYLDACIATWKRITIARSKETLWNQLHQTKPIYLEERSQMHNSIPFPALKDTVVDSVLSAYSTAVATGNGRGALLFAVVGGSLSEGINFSDALGRGVIVVGLPFPNPHSAEWKAKSQYISAKTSQRGEDGKVVAREFFENSCMRAVNQCVGRAIRHQGDYAVILMLDKRYGGKRIQDKLPKWIHASMVNQAGRDIETLLDNFFASKA